MPALPRTLAGLALVALVAGCGSAGGGGSAGSGGAGGGGPFTAAGSGDARCGQREKLGRLPPFPEPARSPALNQRPAGRVVRLPGRPEGLAFDERDATLAVGINEPRGLIVFADGESGRTRRRVPLPDGPRHLRFDHAGGPLLAPSEDAGILYQVPVRGGRIVSTKVGRQPHDVTPAVGRRIFVINELDSSMSVIQGKRVICTLPTPANPGGVAAAEDGERVGAVGVRGNTMRLYDARRLRGVGEVGVGIGPTHVVSNGKTSMMVADTRGDAIIFVRTRPRLEVVSRQALPGSAPYGLAYDRRRDELWVTSTARNRVVLFRGRTRVRSLPTVRQPNSVAVDERTGRVFVAGRYNELELIDRPKDAGTAAGGD